MSASNVEQGHANRSPADGSPVDQERAAAAIREFLDACGLDLTQPELRRTPERVAEAASELFAGVGVDPVPALREGRIPAPDQGLVLLRNIRFRAMCAHHLLPFDGWIHLAYLPGDSIVGFGRLYDLVETVTSRPTLQETVGEQLVDAVMSGLGARGALAVVEARQGCVADRGPRQADSDSVSMASRGALQDSADRAEAFRLIALATVDRDDPRDD